MNQTRAQKYVSRLSQLLLSTLLASCAVYGKNIVIDPRPVPPFTVSERQTETTYLDFMAVGDTGTGGEGQKRVASAMAEQAQVNPMAFVLLLGDNFYEFGISSDQAQEWQSKFEQVYFQESLQIPFKAVLGNHDHLGNPEAQLAYSKLSEQAKAHNSRWSMPSRYYSFSQKIDATHSVAFFALDTNPITNPLFDVSEQLAWLEEQLKNSQATWKIVYGHHPLYSGGEHGNNPEMIKRIEPLLVKYKVDLFLAGHDHDQQMLRPHQGVYHVVSGAGAKSRNVHWTNNTIYAATNFGFTTYRVSSQEMVISFFTGQGKREFAYMLTKNP